MSEEELRQYLIDEIDLQKEFLNQHEVGFIREDEEERLSALETALNLIEKHQKEIKKYKKFIEDKTKIGKDIQTFINKDYVEQEYISKDKIRDKIKNSEILKHNYLANTETSAIVYKDIIDIVDAQINVLKELLGE